VLGAEGGWVAERWGGEERGAELKQPFLTTRLSKRA